ncbi:uncharacterized protein LOC142591597 isoform X5 [Dermacentor variabilis]|uniref:uncharacterized protein LOC142591597 isoform X5 n=1 Tax=Dermacentor variabilis TaxID=34621 RepID=UPI003F5B1668
MEEGAVYCTPTLPSKKKRRAQEKLLRSPVACALLPAISLLAVPGASLEPAHPSMSGPSPGKTPRFPIAVDIPVPPDRRTSAINIVTNPSFDGGLEQAPEEALYSTIQPKHECGSSPGTPPPPLPPKQLEVLYTKPIKEVMKELQQNVERVSEENKRLKQYEKCITEAKTTEQEKHDLFEQLKDAQSQYKYDVDHLSQQVSQLEREKQELEGALAKLQQEHDQLLISTQNSVSFQFHTTAMLEVKRLLEELKQKYQNDKENLTHKVQLAEQERQELKQQLVQLEEEVGWLRSDHSALSGAYRRAVRQNHTLVTHLRELQDDDSEMHSLLSSLLVTAHQVVSERDSLEIKNEEKEKECQRMLELLGQHNVDIDQLNKYLKNIQDQTEDEKHKVKHRREVEGNLQEEYEQQISHLHTKVEQKQQELESVHREKRKLERELEQLWQVLAHETELKALPGDTAQAFALHQLASQN